MGGKTAKTWILQNRTQRWQQQHTGDVVATVAVLPAKNQLWQPYKESKQFNMTHNYFIHSWMFS